MHFYFKYYFRLFRTAFIYFYRFRQFYTSTWTIHKKKFKSITYNFFVRLMFSTYVNYKQSGFIFNSWTARFPTHLDFPCSLISVRIQKNLADQSNFFSDEVQKELIEYLKSIFKITPLNNLANGKKIQRAPGKWIHQCAKNIVAQNLGKS